MFETLYISSTPFLVNSSFVSPELEFLFTFFYISINPFLFDSHNPEMQIKMCKESSVDNKEKKRLEGNFICYGYFCVMISLEFFRNVQEWQ